MAGYRTALLAAVFGILLGALRANPTYAHCDGLDGPVVKAAQEALAKGDMNLVLIWVQKSDEAEIRRAFERTMNVRKLGPQAQDLADTFFFETLVRTHRAGEGAPFTGLKPAGRDLGPAIPAADQALKSGDVTPLTELLVARMRSGLADRFKLAMAARKFTAQDIDAGREYVEKYVAFIPLCRGDVRGRHSSGRGPLSGRGCRYAPIGITRAFRTRPNKPLKLTAAGFSRAGDPGLGESW